MNSQPAKAKRHDDVRLRLALRELRSARQTLHERGVSSDSLRELEQQLTTAIGYRKGESRPTWPIPLMDEPDRQTLEIWLEDSGCEATDGCFVEHDGVCEHGHPSWFLALGLI